MSDALDAVRGFNRFFTQYVGALDPDFLGTDLSLPEARVLFEIAHAAAPMAADIQAALDLDAGYLSRILARFETRGLIVRGRGEEDGRKRPIALTAAGQAAFAELDRRQRDKVAQALAPLAPSQRQDLVSALNTARGLLSGRMPGEVSLRAFRAGDMGLVSARQSLLYRETYGWGPGIEANIGEVTAAFLRNFKPGREQCWVAEQGGVMAGSIFLTDEGDGLSRLRLLYVEPFARGQGLGETLVSTCLGFAREVGYQTMTLWTHTILESARRIYAAHGFEIVEVAVHETFGHPLQGETWRVDLTTSR